jgi:hypothetical protein
MRHQKYIDLYWTLPYVRSWPCVNAVTNFDRLWYEAIKRWMYQAAFQICGLEKVWAEFSFTTLAYNGSPGRSITPNRARHDTWPRQELADSWKNDASERGSRQWQRSRRKMATFPSVTQTRPNHPTRC